VSENLTIDQRLDKYVDVLYDIATYAMANSDKPDALKVKAFDRITKLVKDFAKDAERWL